MATTRMEVPLSRPSITQDDIDAAAELTGRADAAPVVTEPFTEWVLAGEFKAGRPAWDAAGATFVGIGAALTTASR